MYYFLVIPFVVVIGTIVAAKYLNEEEKNFINGLSRDEHPLKILYPLSVGIYKFIYKGNRQDIFGTTDVLREIYVDERPEYSQKVHGCKCIAMIIMISVVAGLLGFAYTSSDKRALVDDKYLERKPAGEGETEYDLYYTGFLAERSDIKVKVSEKKLSGEELEKLKTDARYYIDKEILLKNETAQCVRGKLNLMTSIGRTSIKVKWSEEDSWFIGTDGSLKNTDYYEPVSATLHAVLTYFDESWDYEKDIVIYPPIVDEAEEFQNKLSEELSERDKETQTSDLFELPQELDGRTIGWEEEEDSTPKLIIIFGLVGIFVVIPGMKQDIKKKQKERSEQMIRDYPDIISKFVMLITAGMTCRGAWGKICFDYQRIKDSSEKKENKINTAKKKKEFRYAYEEMLISQKEMDLGMPEVKVYERFGNRCGISAYNRFGNLLSRNIKRGSAAIIEILDSESKDSFTERRENVRKKGEEAGTKLLLPMFGMLILVIAIVVVPAFSSFNL